MYLSQRFNLGQDIITRRHRLGLRHLVALGLRRLVAHARPTQCCGTRGLHHIPTLGRLHGHPEWRVRHVLGFHRRKSSDTWEFLVFKFCSCSLSLGQGVAIWPNNSRQHGFLIASFKVIRFTCGFTNWGIGELIASSTPHGFTRGLTDLCRWPKVAALDSTGFTFGFTGY